MTEIQVGRAEYISVTETAKLVRKALARHFPDYEFTVRSDKYAGGASINVSWVDGPPVPVVDEVIHPFAGGRFDGMIDLAFNVEHWLMPDGSAVVADSPGTQGSRGVYPEVLSDPPSPDARLVSFMADHVMSQRTLTPEADAVIQAKVREKWGDNITAPPGSGGCDDWWQRVCRSEIEKRWLFPPCKFIYAVERMQAGGYVVEADGFTTKTAAGRKAKELEKARNPRGYRYVRAHRPGSTPEKGRHGNDR